jgi:hypothetical protein
VEIDEFGEGTVLVSVRVHRGDQWSRLTLVGSRFVGFSVVDQGISSWVEKLSAGASVGRREWKGVSRPIFMSCGARARACAP